MLNEDYRDMLRALSDEKVKFLFVSAYAMAAYGYPRATMDMDIWVMPSPRNADAVLRAWPYGVLAPASQSDRGRPKKTELSSRSELLQGESTSSLQHPDWLLLFLIAALTQAGSEKD